MNVVARQKERGGYVIIFVAITMALIMGALGFAIDAAVLYTIRAKLSAACDAAALAAARNLNVGMTVSAQEEAATARAKSFYSANFPATYLGATRNAPRITIPLASVGNVLTVTTEGSATAPTFFMRYFGMNSINIRASGTASRRDVNVMLVLDRSTSMTQNDPGKKMPGIAIDFLLKFSEGRDQVGLAVFGTNVFLVSPSTTFKSALSGYINQITYGDNTNIVTAYTRSYWELASLNEPSALNVILLFTDGNPNGIDARYRTANRKNCNGGFVDGVLTRGSPNKAPMIGEIKGLYKWQASSVTSMKPARVDGASDCEFKKNGDLKVIDDIDGIPDQDLWGNRTRGYPNQYHSFAGHINAWGKIKSDSPWVQFLAGKNALDHAAMRIREERYRGANIGVVTFVIGLRDPNVDVNGPKGPGQPINEIPDAVLMRRVANDPAGQDDPNTAYRYDPELPDGMYIEASDTNQLAAAFQRIASEVLRLSN